VTARIVAAFDFDGTITRRDSLVPFLVTVAGRTAVLRALGAESPSLARAAAGRGDRDAAKERVLTRVLAGRAHADIEAAGRVFANSLVDAAVTPQARERITWHHREGHEVVIVSASLDVYLEPVARSLGVGQVLSTSLDVDEHGRCTGRLQGANCRGPEKAIRLRTLIGDDTVELWAYGNSSGDAEMLALAHYPVRVRRGRVRPGVPPRPA
jgi:phosphatidylglycerophosphatase C